MSRFATQEHLLEIIERAVHQPEGQQGAAQRWGVSPAYVCDVRRRRRAIGGKLLKALGYRRVVLYESIGREGR
jgi:hypothetical protein